MKRNLLGKIISLVLACCMLAGMLQISVFSAIEMMPVTDSVVFFEDFSDDIGPFENVLPGGIAGQFNIFNDSMAADDVVYFGTTKEAVFDRPAGNNCYATIFKAGEYTTTSHKFSYNTNLDVNPGDIVTLSFDFASNNADYLKNGTDKRALAYYSVMFGANPDDIYETETLFQASSDGKNWSNNQNLFMYNKARIHIADNIRNNWYDYSIGGKWHNVKLIINTINKEYNDLQTIECILDGNSIGVAELNVANKKVLECINNITFKSQPIKPIVDADGNLLDHKFYWDNIELKIDRASQKLDKYVVLDEDYTNIGDMWDTAGATSYFGVNNIKYKMHNFTTLDAVNTYGTKTAGEIEADFGVTGKEDADDVVMAYEFNDEFTTGNNSGQQVEISKTGEKYGQGENVAIAKIGAGQKLTFSFDVAMTAPTSQHLYVALNGYKNGAALTGTCTMRAKRVFPIDPENDVPEFSNVQDGKLLYLRNGNLCGNDWKYLNSGIGTQQWKNIAITLNPADEACDGQSTYTVYFEGEMVGKYILDADRSTEDVIEPLQDLLSFQIRLYDFIVTNGILDISEVYFDNIHMEVTGDNVTGPVVYSGDSYNKASNTFELGTLNATRAIIPVGSEQNATLIVAQYVDNKLVDIAMESKTVTIDDRDIKVEFPVTVPGGKIVTYLWGEEGRPLKLQDTINYSKSIKLFVAGDSLAQNYSNAWYPMGGYGMYLSERFKDTVTVINRGISGRSTTTFYDNEWKQIMRDASEGDYVMLALMHNDFTHTSLTDYKANLARYADEAKTAGVKLIFVTSPNMATTDPVFTVGDNNFIGAMKEVAENKDVLYLDINAKSLEVIEEKGLEWAKNNIFLYNLVANGVLTQTQLDNFPAQSVRQNADNQHLSRYGARLVGEWIAEALSESSDITLKSMLLPIVNDPLDGYITPAL